MGTVIDGGNIDGSRVRLARANCDLTLQQLADAVGISVQALGNIERNNAQPSAPNLWRIAQATGQAMAWFYEDAAPAPSAPEPAASPGTQAAASATPEDDRLSRVEARLARVERLLERQDAHAERHTRLLEALLEATLEATRQESPGRSGYPEGEQGAA